MAHNNTSDNVTKGDKASPIDDPWPIKNYCLPALHMERVNVIDNNVIVNVSVNQICQCQCHCQCQKKRQSCKVQAAGCRGLLGMQLGKLQAADIAGQAAAWALPV